MNDADLIMATLDEYAEAYCAKDLPRLMDLFVPGDGISLIGTGNDELCAGREQVSSVFARNFAGATASKFEWGWKDIVVHGDCAVVAIALKIHLTIDGTALAIPIRWTVSLVKHAGAWKWLHRNASTPAVSQDDGDAYPSGEN